MRARSKAKFSALLCNPGSRLTSGGGGYFQVRNSSVN